ncbi:hypothetical protein GOP47_0026237 [Adiantum capillus-veneris]|nr:hypothetical protein GOP47_0026237 [Adiantum capillus-veneris]
MAEQTTAGKEKGGDEIVKDVVTTKDVLMAEQGTEEVTTIGKQEGENGVKTQRNEGQPSRKEDDVLLFDKLFFEGGKIMHNGKQLSSLEMMIRILNGM